MVARSKRFALWWYRAGMGLRATLVMVAAASIGLLLYLQQPDDGTGGVSNNFLVFVLVNLNIVLICVLAFLIGRNIVRLIFDRRRGILGSKLRTRLVVAFVGLTLIPSVLLFVVSSGRLTAAMEGWFSNQIDSAVKNAVRVARLHVGSLREQNERLAEELVNELQQRRATSESGAWELEREWLEQRRKREGLFSISLIDQQKTPLLRVESAAAEIENFQEPAITEDVVRRALSGATLSLVEERGANQFIRAYRQVTAVPVPVVLVVSRRVTPELSQALATMNASFRDYEQLKLFKQPLKSSNLLSLALITGLILMAAMWFGFYLAREMTGPIQKLAEGMKLIARGNFNVQLRSSGDDEIGFLVSAFNRMTQDLRQSRIDVDTRQRFIETILSNLAIGVVSTDRFGHVRVINDAAREILGIPIALPGSDTTLKEVFSEAVYGELADMIEAAFGAEGPRERQIKVIVGGSERSVVCTVGQMLDPRSEPQGLVLLLDDVTELSRAQHMAAWREVARRIAHEIKNPLTPIQLSAQRLVKLCSSIPSVAPAVSECSQSIVEHVDSIKRLADEFSHFARMPTAQFELVNLNDLLSDTITHAADIHPDVAFQFVLDHNIPDVMLDREQVRRVVLNLLDNAVAALSTDTSRTEQGRVVVRTSFDKRARSVRFEVNDNGPGIAPQDKPRVFEPYFTTKKGGTGLGLAIVTSVVADHQGTIRVFDNQPRGAKFIVDLPVEPRAVTQRAFSPR